MPTIVNAYRLCRQVNDWAIMTTVEIKENVSLKNYSTMRLGGTVRWLAEASSEEVVQELVSWAKHRSANCLMIGRGANIVWRDEGFDGLLIVNKIKSLEIIDEDKDSATVRIGAGENWDDVVAWTVKHGWSGIEFLSLIPGTAGAAPIQNIGAYGAEIAETLLEVGAYDTRTEAFGGIQAANCNFSYRSSRFKTEDKGRFFITSIVLKLSKSSPKPPFYESLDAYLKENAINEFKPADIRDAVIAIRTSKLPDPNKVANNGSFFTNPIVDEEKVTELKERYPQIKCWPEPDNKIKLSAAWMIETAGFRDFHDEQTGMATWPTQAMTLINESAKSTADLLAFKQKITDKVKEKFGISLEQEPELLP